LWWLRAAEDVKEKCSSKYLRIWNQCGSTPLANWLQIAPLNNPKAPKGVWSDFDGFGVDWFLRKRRQGVFIALEILLW